jgi:tetratricopeptide (TPR) repeat protein
MKTHVGVDLHQRFCYLTAVDASEKTYKQGQVVNEGAALRAWLRQVPGPRQVVVEASGFWPAFARSVAAHTYLGTTLYFGQGKVQEALAQWRKALELNSDYTLALIQTAQALSASPAASDRNGAEAVKLAERAVELSKGEDPVFLDTLGMAYAENGRFADAVETARRAQRLARAQNNSSLADVLDKRINLYQARQPYRDDLPTKQ